MSKKVIPLITGETYHIFNRGVDKRDIFLSTYDVSRFQKSLRLFNALNPIGSLFEFQFKNRAGVRQKPLVHLHAYCLLPNHFHLLMTQRTNGGISEFMKRVSGGYTSYLNERYDRSGSLFQGVYKRVHIRSNEQLLYVSAYINLNDKVHNITSLKRKKLCKSSFCSFIEKGTDVHLYTNIILDQYANTDLYRKDAQRLVEEISFKRRIDKYDNDLDYLLE